MQDPVALVDKDPNFFTKFTHIIANNFPDSALLKLSKICWQHNIPIFISKSYGFVGYLRIAAPEHTGITANSIVLILQVIEAKPDNPPDDLRVLEPFEELSSFADSLDLESMDSTAHSHTPFIVLLVKYLKKWRQEVSVVASL